MPTSDYYLGLALLAVGWGGPAIAAWRVTGLRLHGMAREARAVAFGLLLVAGIALTTAVPLVLGVMSQATVAVAGALVGVLSLGIRPAAGAPAEAPAPAPASPPAARVVAGLFLATITVYVLAFERYSAPLAIPDTDSTSFIIPTLKSWITSGSMWDAQDYTAGWAFGAYPHTGTLVQVAAMVPWQAEFPLRFVGLGFFTLSAVAAYALAVELGAARAHAAAVAGVAVMIPAGVIPSLAHAQTDALAAAGLTAGVLFACRHARGRRRADLALAALAFGLAFGTKWYGPPQAAGLFAVWGAALLLARRGADLRPMIGVGIATVAIGGLWLIRNLVEFGSPLFPSKAGVFDGPERTLSTPLDWPLIHYAGDLDLLLDPIAPALVRSFALTGGLLLVAVALAALAARTRRDGRVLAVAVAVPVLLAIYAATPFTALGPEGQPVLVGAAARYAVPAFLIAAAVAAWFLTRASAAVQVAAVLGGAAGLAHSISRYNPDSPDEFPVAVATIVKVALVLAVLAAAAVAVRRRPRLLAAGAALVAFLGFAAARGSMDAQTQARFAREAAFTFIAEQAPAGHSIGIAGVFGGSYSFTAAAFGPRIENDVVFIGPRRTGLLERDRTQAAFARRLDDSEVDYLVVGAEPRRPARELAWARAAGWEELASGPRYVVFAPPPIRG